MRLKNVKVFAGLLAATMTFSSANMVTLASDVRTVLPSVGVDYTLSNKATSLADLKENVELENTTASTKEAAGLSTKVVSAEKSENTTASEKEIHTTQELVISDSVKEKILQDIERDMEEESFKNLVIAQVDHYVNVRAEGNEEAEIVGKLYDDSVGTFIEETEDGWYKISSGSVTGYVKGEFCVTGDAAVELAKEVGTRIATVNTTTLKVRKEPGTDKEVLGLVPIEDQLVVTEELDGWVKVNIEEGDGYVSSEFVDLSTEFVKAESKEEEEARLAKEEAERKAAQEAARKAAAANGNSAPKQSGGDYSAVGSGTGAAVANYALQFVGNPYVYGGTSLTNGADCSGFVMSVYRNFGVSLPHSSAADRGVGYAVDGLANAQAGDIICYSGHVALYIGNGQIVHASTSRTGIIVSNCDYRSILSIRRIF